MAHMLYWAEHFSKVLHALMLCRLAAKFSLAYWDVFACLHKLGVVFCDLNTVHVEMMVIAPGHILMRLQVLRLGLVHQRYRLVGTVTKNQTLVGRRVLRADELLDLEIIYVSHRLQSLIKRGFLPLLFLNVFLHTLFNNRWLKIIPPQCSIKLFRGLYLGWWRGLDLRSFQYFNALIWDALNWYFTTGQNTDFTSRLFIYVWLGLRSHWLLRYAAWLFTDL